jgi:hypothetical protein
MTSKCQNCGRDLESRSVPVYDYEPAKVLSGRSYVGSRTIAVCPRCERDAKDCNPLRWGVYLLLTLIGMVLLLGAIVELLE